MSTLPAVLLAAALGALLAAAVLVCRAALAARRTAVRRQVTVNLLSGQAFVGVLWDRRGRLVVLRGAALLEPGREPVHMDGDVLLDREQVAFIQATG